MTDVYRPEIRLVLGDDNSALAYIDNFLLMPIPEPSTLMLLAIGAVFVSSRRRIIG